MSDLRVQFLLCLGLVLTTGCGPRDGGGIPEQVIRHNIVGTAHLGQTKWADAEAEFRRALELRPGDPLLLTNAAIALNQQEKAEEAIALLERALGVDSGYASAHFNLGLIESRRGDFERAAVHFARVTELEPDDLFTHYYLGTSLARAGRESEAVASLRAALERDPTHVSTLYALGRLLLQQGRQEEGLQLITRSQEIRARSGLDEAVGAEYGEQGRLSRAADYPGGTLEAPPPIDVRFAATDRVAPAQRGRGLLVTALPAAKGAALLLAASSTIQQAFPADRPGLLAHAPLDQSDFVALGAGDADNDGRVDLAALLIFETSREGEQLVPVWIRQDENGRFGRPRPTEEVFSGAAETVLGSGFRDCDITFVDRDHDGDLDLFWCWSSAGPAGGGCKLGTNDGEGRFEVHPSAEHGFEPPAQAAGRVQVAFSDVDNDRDVDLLVAGPEGVWLFANQRDGSFTDVSSSAGLVRAPAGRRSLVVGDLDKDGWMDLVLAGDEGVSLIRNRRGRFDAPAPLGRATGPATRAVVFDFDNDGFLDIAASSPAGLVLLHNRGAGAWEVRPDALRVEGLGAAAEPWVDLDVDGDGDLDLAVADGTNAVVLLVNHGGNANGWVALDSRGVGDNRFGIGAKIEVLAGALRQKFEVTRPLPVHAGLGPRERVDALRYLWPTGVLQDEIGLVAGAPLTVTELDRKGTSCPLLYAWRDGGWQFVTDLLGGAAIGYRHGSGALNVPDTDEYVRIDEGLTVDGNGRLRVRLNNQLEEVIWFDAAELVVVDHPEGTEVYPNERLMPGPPWPPFKLFASADVRPLVAARSVEDGADLTERLRERDRSFADNFALLKPKGYAEYHSLILDLGPFRADERVVLLLDGWVDYADSSANVAAAQAGLALEPPRLHVADGRGGWLEVGDGVMGFPAGLPKTMAVELTGLLPAEDHRLRIGTNMRIYWDRARVMVGGADTPLAVTRLRPERAELGLGGFPRPTSPDGRKPYEYDPRDVAWTHSFKAHEGQYTGLGEVTSLLERIDDRFVTTRSGDQIELTFVAPDPPPAGRARTYLLWAAGFGKDMDPNSAANSRVDPVPFHGMPGYPYPEGIVPPLVQDGAGLAPRTVGSSDAGWPGALPVGHASR